MATRLIHANANRMPVRALGAAGAMPGKPGPREEDQWLPSRLEPPL